MVACRRVGFLVIEATGADGAPAGREDAGALCNACHSLAIVKQQGLSREVWDELLDWMVEEQGMPELERQERDLILGYLANNFGIDKPRN